MFFYVMYDCILSICFIKEMMMMMMILVSEPDFTLSVLALQIVLV